jgi:hypothetical protein
MIMNDYNIALANLLQAKQARTKTIREYWQGGQTKRQGDRVETSIQWLERRKKQLIKIIEHL